MVMKPTSAALVAAFFFFFTPAALRAETTLDALKKSYREIRTVDAHFRQKILIKSLRRERDTEGDFFYKRGRGFRWAYTKPREKTFLYDGSYIWQGEQDKPFVTREKVTRERLEGNFLDRVDDDPPRHTLTLEAVVREGDMDVVLLAREGGQFAVARSGGRPAISESGDLGDNGNVNMIDFTSSL
jgi:outer membrane lipoprotein-sorting protein